MPERSKDWLRQAVRDLESAQSQHENGFYEWACFISQQAAEKAVKAVYQRLGAEVWGHSTTDLLMGLREKISVSDELLDSARRLDRHYIPARYPNGWASGTPAEYLTEKDSLDAISDSQGIIQFCSSFLAQ
jgi:HEPN domain-containing protein